MSQTESIALLFLLAVAVYSDVTTRRIPNVLIAIGLLTALATGLTQGDLATRTSGFAIGLLILLPFFAFRLVGAGDAKLMAVVGAFTGAHALLPISLYTFIFGGLLGIASLVTARSGLQAVRNVRLVLFAVAAKSAGADISSGELGLKPAARIPYAVAIAAGVLCWLLTAGWPK